MISEKDNEKDIQKEGSLEKDGEGKKEIRKEDCENEGDNEKKEVKDDKDGKDVIAFKVGVVGDQDEATRSLLLKYVENQFDDDLTVGINFMEKKLKIKNQEVLFNIWGLGGAKEFVNMLPLVVSDAAAVLIVFNLTKINSLISVKNWYKQCRGFNKQFLPFLIGTEFDKFFDQSSQYRKEIITKARSYARTMRCPLIFSSSRISINVKSIFKVVLARIFNIKPQIEEIHDENCPLLEIDPYTPSVDDERENNNRHDEDGSIEDPDEKEMKTK